MIVLNDDIDKKTVSELIDLLPACIDIKKNEPFNNYWLYIHKRNTTHLRYIVKYVCDSYSSEELMTIPFEKKVWFKWHSHDLKEALLVMVDFLKRSGFINE